ncbi:MAG TPA: prolyl oligopeptidase family serine peptidase [Kofleriaceae bacterium]|nr:prolyl oligopeptidase family serine peptidase [Kofleriaceae bacterium]
MKRFLLLLFVLLLEPGCKNAKLLQTAAPPATPVTDARTVDPWSIPDAFMRTEMFEVARSRFTTKILQQKKKNQAVDVPPPHTLQQISYRGPLGEMAAYVSPDPNDGRKHPAIIWLIGGFSTSISKEAWMKSPPSNDQSAAAFWRAGVITMYPSMRGGNKNPGYKENLYGEVDDVGAAYQKLAALPYVDANRIFLGGHSVGGTLALLVAEAYPHFRATFAFGAAERFRDWGPDNAGFDFGDATEHLMRAPIEWLHSLRSPTYIAEGEGGNGSAISSFTSQNRNPLVHTLLLKDHDHVTYLFRAMTFLANKILADSGTGAFSFDIAELGVAVAP